MGGAAFLDACVLFPAALRNILVRLAVHRLFRAKWSERVHEEWIAAVLKRGRKLKICLFGGL